MTLNSLWYGNEMFAGCKRTAMSCCWLWSEALQPELCRKDKKLGGTFGDVPAVSVKWGLESTQEVLWSWCTRKWEALPQSLQIKPFTFLSMVGIQPSAGACWMSWTSIALLRRPNTCSQSLPTKPVHVESLRGKQGCFPGLNSHILSWAVGYLLTSIPDWVLRIASHKVRRVNKFYYLKVIILDRDNILLTHNSKGI